MGGETDQAGRLSWNENAGVVFHKTRDPTWSWGAGANDEGECLKGSHLEIDPDDPRREDKANYKLLISGIVPRPIGFISTRSLDGSSINLAPMSYTQLVSHDPPVFCLGFAGGFERVKDTLRNLSESKECVFNTVSEHFVEAVNAASVDVPYGISEWDLTGLTPAPCRVVKPSRVKESIFSVECKLVEICEFESRRSRGKKQAAVALVEGVRFWVRADAVDADLASINPNVLRPVSRLGGTSYARLTEIFEIPRPVFGKDLKPEDLSRLRNR